jgi:hypothetical protein
MYQPANLAHTANPSCTTALLAYTANTNKILYQTAHIAHTVNPSMYQPAHLVHAVNPIGTNQLIWPTLLNLV